MSADAPLSHFHRRGREGRLPQSAPVGRSQPPLGWGLGHGDKVSSSGTKFADTPEAPSSRELSTPSGFDGGS